MKNIVSYYRVSTQRQSCSGLGLEAQEEAVRLYQREHAGRVIAAYKEVESGKRGDRHELVRALGHAKRSKAVLVVAKLDRLARNVAFTATLMDSGVDFVACDQPFANRLTIHILAAVAEHEARMISERTKAALAAYRRRGGLLGASLPQCRTLTDKARAKGRKAASITISERARSAYSDIVGEMIDLYESGWSQKAIADHLNEQGHTTRRGHQFSQVQVGRVLHRAAAVFDE